MFIYLRSCTDELEYLQSKTPYISKIFDLSPLLHFLDSSLGMLNQSVAKYVAGTNYGYHVRSTK